MFSVQQAMNRSLQIASTARTALSVATRHAAQVLFTPMDIVNVRLQAPWIPCQCIRFRTA